MATTVTIQEAKAQLSELIHLVEQGEEVVIAQDDQPKVKLVPVSPKKTGERVFGAYRGKIRMSEDFNDPLPSACRPISMGD
jgi:prevent-host-death family protein